MRNHRIIIIFAALGLAANLYAQWPIVPVDHPVYPFLERMEAKGLISGYLDSALPLDRGQVCDYLKQLMQSENHDFRLTRVDRQWLAYFRQEFWDYPWSTPVPKDSTKGWRIIRRTGFLSWLHAGNLWENSHDWVFGEGEDYSWAANPVLRYDFVSDDRYDNAIQRRSSGIDFRAEWKNRVGIFFRFHDTKEWGDGPYYSRSQVYDDRYGYIGPLLGDDFTYYDRTDYGIHLRWGPFRLEGGKWANVWGPGQWGHFLLSNEGTSYDQIRLKVSIGRWGQFTALTGALRQYPPLGDTLYVTAAGDHRIVQASKFVSAHRIDIIPFRNFQFGLSEMVIYGDRGIELGYLLPLNLYYSAEHNYGDQDNVVWGADFKYTGIRGVRWYGEFLLDDLTISKLGTNYYGNKWAALTGAWWTDPIGVPNVSIGAELTAIRPYVGSHRFLVDTPINWTRPLGDPFPPNSITWTFGGEYQPIRSVQVSFRFDYQRHGTNTPDLNVGGDASLPHRPQDPETVRFVAGDVQTNRYWMTVASWEPLPRLSLEVVGGGHSGDSGEYDWIRVGFYLNF
jgi:hypothetical protein